MKVSDYFKITKSNIGLTGSYVRFFRTKDGWTSNTFWLMKTAIEPDIVKNVRDFTTEAPDVTRILPTDTSILEELTVQNEFKIMGGPTVKLSYEQKPGTEDSTIVSVWINAYFIALFEKIGDVTFKGKKNDGRSFMSVFLGDELVGIVAPIVP